MESFLDAVSQISPIDWIGMVTGVAGVYFSIKEKSIAWFFFILCYACYTFIGFRQNYYSFAGLNILFVGLGIYGWWKWTRKGSVDEDELHISQLPRKFWVPTLLFVATGTVTLGLLTSNLEDANRPFLDGFATCSALAAQWMLSRKYLANWFAWIVADVVWIYVFIADQIWTSVVLFTIFIVLAIKGIREWSAQIKKRVSESCR